MTLAEIAAELELLSTNDLTELMELIEALKDAQYQSVVAQQASDRAKAVLDRINPPSPNPNGGTP